MSNFNRGVTFPTECLDSTEVQKLLAACPSTGTGLRDRAIYVCLWRAGLRSFEATALEERDIAEDGTVNVRCGKGRKQRLVALDPAGHQVVKDWIAEKRRLGWTGPLFCTSSGKPVLTCFLRNKIKKLAKKADISKRCHCHGMRHSFAADLAAAKVDLRVISAAMGHSNCAVTDTYIRHLTNSAVTDVLKARTW